MEKSKLIRKTKKAVPLFAIGMLMLMVFMIVMFVLVARNPEKFSPKTVKFFIKPSSLVGYEKTRKQSKKRKYKK